MPPRWQRSIEAHRQDVHAAIVETTAKLVAKVGLASVTMSRIAEETGIGRATLYKHFQDVDAILVAWHERHVDDHLRHLAAVRDAAEDAGERVKRVLEAYAIMAYERAQMHRGTEVSAVVHRDEHVARLERRLSDFFRELLSAAGKAGAVRADIPAEDLASYCLGALDAARRVPSRAAVRRVVAVTLAGLRPPRSP